MSDTATVIRDEYGCVDWKANGWPEPNPYGIGDTSTMPYEIWKQWADICDMCENAWEVDE